MAQPYAPIDVNMAEHPRNAVLSNAAFRAHVRGILYANRLLSDGRVPVAIAIGYGRQAVDELVRRGHWTRDGDEYLIHDFDQWNPTRAEVEARRAAKAVGGAARGQQKHEQMLSKRLADANQPLSTRLANAEQNVSEKLATRAGGTSTSTSTSTYTSKTLETLAPRAAPRARDFVFEGLCEACGMDWHELTNRERSKVNSARSELVARLDSWNPASKSLILERAANWPAVMGSATITPNGIVSNWARLNGVQRSPDRPTAFAETEQLARRLEAKGR